MACTTKPDVRRVEQGQEAIEVDTRYIVQADHFILAAGKILSSERRRVLLEEVTMNTVKSAVVQLENDVRERWHTWGSARTWNRTFPSSSKNRWLCRLPVSSSCSERDEPFVSVYAGKEAGALSGEEESDTDILSALANDCTDEQRLDWVMEEGDR